MRQPQLSLSEPQPIARELRRIAILGVLALGLGGLALSTATGWRQSSHWLLVSLVLWSLVWLQAWQRQELNRPTVDAPPYPDLGIANRLTLMRGLLISATAGFILMPSATGILPWVAAALYSTAAILDRLDGQVARRSGQPSLLGAELDTVFDALGLLVAPVLAVLTGKIHASYLLVSIAYYLFVAGLRWRQAHGQPVYPLPPSRLRRALAGFQMGYVAVVLWPPFGAAVTVPAGFGFMAPLLLGFWVDWLWVSGRLDPAAPLVARNLTVLDRLSTAGLQPLLRLVAAAAVLMRVPMPETVITLGLWLSAGLLLLGVLGRWAALAILVLLAWEAQSPGVDGVTLIAVYGAIGTLLLGTGRFSLWQADDVWVHRQDGA